MKLKGLFSDTRVETWVDLLVCLVVLPCLIAVFPVEEWVIWRASDVIVYLLWTYLCWYLGRHLIPWMLATDNALPGGVVYQILLFTSPRHATQDELHGLDPVYERLTNALRYTYSVGVFHSFNEALLQLNPVRALGFPDAEIVAFLDGRPVDVLTARRAE